MTTNIDGVVLKKQIDVLLEYYDNYPVGEIEGGVHITAIFDHYDEKTHISLLKHLKALCRNSLTSTALHALDIENLYREEGGFQIVLRSDDCQSKDDSLDEIKRFIKGDLRHSPRPITLYNTNSIEEFESSCQIRCGSNLEKEKYGESFGTAKLVTFIASENCPWRLILELRRILYHPEDAGLKGKVQVVSTEGFPANDDFVWHTNTLWITYDKDNE